MLGPPGQSVRALAIRLARAAIVWPRLRDLAESAVQTEQHAHHRLPAEQADKCMSLPLCVNVHVEQLLPAFPLRTEAG